MALADLLCRRSAYMASKPAFDTTDAGGRGRQGGAVVHIRFRTIKWLAGAWERDWIQLAMVPPSPSQRQAGGEKEKGRQLLWSLEGNGT